MTCLVSRRSLGLDACCSRFILFFEGEGEGEGLGCKGESLLPYFLKSSRAFFRLRRVVMRMPTIGGAACLGSGDTCERVYDFLGL